MDVLGRNSERHRQEMVKEAGVDLAMTAMRNHAKQAYVVEWSLKAICTLSADDDDARVCLKRYGRLRREKKDGFDPLTPFVRLIICSRSWLLALALQM
jgi:hypothetical protein